MTFSQFQMHPTCGWVLCRVCKCAFLTLALNVFIDVGLVEHNSLLLQARTNELSGPPRLPKPGGDDHFPRTSRIIKDMIVALKDAMADCLIARRRLLTPAAVAPLNSATADCPSIS